MKKIASVLLAITFIVSLFGCEGIGKPKLDAEQQAMLDTVMSNLEVWETHDGKNAVYIQLQEISGSYCICVGYDDSTSVQQDEAVYTFSYDFSESYNIDRGILIWVEGGSMVLPAENYMWGGIGTGRKNVGSIFWDVTESSDSKFASMESLFLNLVEEK